MSNAGLRLSVVIPTCNRADRVLRLLGALAAQDIAEPFEVVVVDDASKDDTVARLRDVASAQPFPLSILATEVNTGPAGARNRGWRAAQGELIAFVDDDCVPDPKWLRSVVSGLVEADIAVGRTLPPDDQLHLVGPFSSYIVSEHDQSFLTCNIGFRRAVLDELDGFDETRFTCPNGEDTDLGLRAIKAGYRDRYVPGALVWHDVGPSQFSAHFRRIRRLEGIVALVSRHPEARNILHAGWFLRSVDKAVLVSWAAALGLLLRPRRIEARLFGVLAVLLYLWQFNRSHYRANSVEEWAKAVPLGFVADSWAVVVMIRSSLRYRTVLL
jgi:GT2 family glycosyltransferase